MVIDSVDECVPWEQTLEIQFQAAIAAARRAGDLAAYKHEWGMAGITAADIDARTWAKIPTLSKDALLDAASTSPPFGQRLGVERSRIAHVFVAPGPLYMPFTEEDFDRVALSFAKALKACGFGPGDVVDQTTMYNWVIAASVIDRALGKLGCCVVPGGVGQSERHLEAITHLDVDGIVAFPTFLEHLLELAGERKQGLRLKKAAVMGELRDPQAKERMQASHGVVVREFYGVADVGAVAWECDAGAGMHLRDDLFVEFMAPGTMEPITPTPAQPAELVVTDLHREAMPIIRLRTGDIVDGLDRTACPCGRTSPRFTRIVGRASEITKVKGMFVVPRTIADLLRAENLDRAFRLVVDRDESGRDTLELEIAGPPPQHVDEFRAKAEHALRVRAQLRFDAVLPEGGPRLVDRRFAKGS